MNGTSNPESDALRQQLVEKLEERFERLPDALREALQTTMEDPESPERLQQLLDLATDTKNQDLVAFLRVALRGSHRGTPQTRGGG